MPTEEERKNASRMYRWLWIAPFLTVPTLFFLYFFLIFISGFSSNPDSAVMTYIVIAATATWHFILVFKVAKRTSKFERWHGRQALFLTFLHILLTTLFIDFGQMELINEALIILILSLFLLASIGGGWGQTEVNNGISSFMRWFGGENGTFGENQTAGRKNTKSAMTSCYSFTQY